MLRLPTTAPMTWDFLAPMPQRVITPRRQRRPWLMLTKNLTCAKTTSIDSRPPIQLWPRPRVLEQMRAMVVSGNRGHFAPSMTVFLSNLPSPSPSRAPPSGLPLARRQAAWRCRASPGRARHHLMIRTVSLRLAKPARRLLRGAVWRAPRPQDTGRNSIHLRTCVVETYRKRLNDARQNVKIVQN